MKPFLMPSMNTQDLEAAASAYGITTKELLQLGASGTLPIYTIPNARWHLTATLSKKVEKSPLGPDFHVSEAEVTGPALSLMLLRIPPLSLGNFLRYPDDAAVDVFLVDGLKDDDMAVMAPTPGSSILIKECHLVVKPEELEKCLSKRPKHSMPRKLTAEERKARDAQALEQMKDGDSASPTDVTTPPQRSTSNTTPSEYLRLSEVAAMLSVSENTVRNYVEKQGFPAPTSLGGRAMFYSRAEIKAWIEGRRK